MMHGTPTCELLAIPPCQTRQTDTAARVSVTGGVVEAVVVSTGGKEGWGGGQTDTITQAGQTQEMLEGDIELR